MLMRPATSNKGDARWYHMCTARLGSVCIADLAEASGWVGLQQGLHSMGQAEGGLHGCRAPVMDAHCVPVYLPHEAALHRREQQMKPLAGN